jgi:hypothetical protein
MRNGFLLVLKLIYGNSQPSSYYQRVPALSAPALVNDVESNALFYLFINLPLFLALFLAPV